MSTLTEQPTIRTLLERARTGHGGVIDDAELDDLVREVVDLEQRYAREACSEAILGMRPERFAEYVEYVADRRCSQLDLPEQYGTANPFEWLSEAADLNREKSFFETQVTEYQSGG